MVRFLFIFSLLLFQAAFAAQPVTLSEQESLSLDARFDYLEDPESELTISRIVQQDADWQQSAGDSFNRGYSNSTWWLNITLDNRSLEAKQRLLEVAYPLLDDVQIFVTDGGRVIQEYSMGDHYPHPEHPIINSFFVVPLDFEPEQTLDVYIRIRTTSSVQAPLRLWQPGAFSQHDAKTSIVQGLYYGAMLVIIVYNLLIFLMLLDRSYLYYVGFVSSMTLLMAALTGEGFRYIWPNTTAFNDYAVSVSISVIVVSANLFTDHFLELRRRAPALRLMTLTLAGLGCLGLLLSFIIPYHLMMTYLVPLGLLSSLGNILVGTVSWYRGVTLARYYCLAWAFFLIGSVILTLSKLMILPSNDFTNNAIQVGSVLEAVLLSFALAARINVERRLRTAAQEETISTVKRLNTQLEQRVEERTRELERLNQQLRTLSNTDPLTSIPNRRQMEDKLISLWHERADRRSPLAVIMLDIDLFKAVNDQHGHQAGDACLKQVAHKIAGCLRSEIDLLARYGGEEFCLLLPATNAAAAMAMSERIRTAVADHWITRADGPSFQVTISLGVCVSIPDQDTAAESALNQADIALYQSKENGRNRSTLFSPEFA